MDSSDLGAFAKFCANRTTKSGDSSGKKCFGCPFYPYDTERNFTWADCKLSKKIKYGGSPTELIDKASLILKATSDVLISDELHHFLKSIKSGLI